MNFITVTFGFTFREEFRMWTSMSIISQSTTYYWTSMLITSQSTAYYWTSMPIISRSAAYYWTSMPICFVKKSIYGPQNWVGMISKKTRAENCCILACFARRDLSYETNSRPKTKTVSGVISGVLCIGIRHRLIIFFLVMNINLLYKAFLWSKFVNLR